LANSSSQIDQVLQAVDIVDVISDVVELQKKGKNFVGLCPFHADSNPSMTVSPEKQIYKCFSCGAGGNVFAFVQNFEQISFSAALQKLAQRAGIDVQVQVNPHQASYKTNQQASAYYQFVLHNTKEGHDVIQYLSERGLTPDTIKVFGLGYAPAKQSLVAALEKQKLTPLDLVKVGLIHDTSANELFRQRLMIPIDDADGRIVGFSGRVLQGQEAKYINSPDSPIFHKSRVLYNLSRAKLAAKQAKRLLIVEGYMDVFQLVQAGYPEVVAVMGTAFTKEHAALITGLQVPVYFLFDGDAAGQTAALKSAYNATKLDAYVSLLPAGMDPDEFLNAHDATALQALLDGSIIAADFVYQQFLAQANFDSSASLDAFKRNVLQYLREQSPALQERYFARLAGDLNISVESLQRQVKQPPARPADARPRTVSAKFLAAERLLLNVMRTSKEQAYMVDQHMNTWIKPEHEQLKDVVLQYYQTYSTYQADRLFLMVPEALKEEALVIFQEAVYLSKPQIMGLFGTIEEYQLTERLKYLQHLRKTASPSEKMAIANEEMQIQQQLKRGGDDE
jgi:DNA primase